MQSATWVASSDGHTLKSILIFLSGHSVDMMPPCRHYYMVYITHDFDHKHILQGITIFKT